MKLTEDLLLDAAGWQVMKEARSLLAAGRVISGKYDPPLLVGQVRGEPEYRAGFKILSRTDLENICGCPASRRRSQACAHSVAVGLAVIKGNVSDLKPSGDAIGETSTSTVKAGVNAAKVALPKFPFHLAVESPDFQLHIILPPKLEEAIKADLAQLAVEVSLAGQSARKPLGTLDVKKYRGCDYHDQAFLRAWWEHSQGQLGSVLQLKRSYFSGLLEQLAGHPRVSVGKAAEIAILEESLPVVLQVAPSAGGGVRLSVAVEPRLIVSEANLWQWHLGQGTLRRICPGLPASYGMVFKMPIDMPAAALPAFVRNELPVVASFFTVVGLEHLPKLEELPPPPPPEPLHLQLEGSLNALVGTFIGRMDGTRMAQLGFVEKKGEFHLRGEREILSFFANGLPSLQRDWKVSLGERFTHVTRHVERVEPRFEVKGSGENWFDLAVEMETVSGQRYTANDLNRLLANGQSHLKRPDGRITVFDAALLEDFRDLLEETQPEQRSPGLFRMAKRQSASVAAFAVENRLQLAADSPWLAGASALNGVDNLKPFPLGDMEAKLRPYQKHGVYWFAFLARNRFGGVLADEMGLGKTVQTLAFLREQVKRGGGPHLIVCPASLLFNWRNEAAKWVPELSVLVLEGAKRAERFSAVADSAIVLTSYPLLRQDAEWHATVKWRTVVLDEAQHIKNPESQLAQAACGLRAELRFGLTGTPVENSVRDLWSLFHFVMPGYLGSRKDFKERYESTLTSQSPGSEAARAVQRRLSRRVAPFILRRTKTVVAKDLPARLEQIQWCEMSSAQAEIYQGLAQATRKQLADLSGSKEQKKHRMVMLTALLRLRQAACHVSLLGLENPPPPEERSGKLEHLMELLEEAREGGHRVLVFSQFVRLLGEIRARLESTGLDYCYLDGQSRDRADQVQRFQTATVPVFLISLKAGGTGLNLTAADTVIHFDPWWNPAVEAQATDRAHRIGQTKVVTSHKFIARGTVEEKILALQERKKHLIAATLNSEQPMMDGLSLGEIAELLE